MKIMMINTVKGCFEGGVAAAFGGSKEAAVQQEALAGMSQQANAAGTEIGRLATRL